MGDINGALHIIGGPAIYGVQLADEEIDPERTNMPYPARTKKVLSYGNGALPMSGKLS